MAALANGVRYRKGCLGVSTDQAAACLRSSIVESDVVAFLPWFHRGPAEQETDSASLLQLFAFSVVSLLFFPLMAHGFAAERKRGLLEMLRIQSLRPLLYWAANYFWFVLVAFLTSFVYSWLFLLVREEDGFDGSALVLVHFLWAHAQTAFALLLAAFFWQSEAIVAITYFVMLLTLGASLNLAFVLKTRWPLLLVLFPPTNYIRSLVLVLKYPSDAGTTGDATGADGQPTTEESALSERLSYVEKMEWEELLLVQALLPFVLIFVGVALLTGQHLILWNMFKKKLLWAVAVVRGGRGNKQVLVKKVRVEVGSTQDEDQQHVDLDDASDRADPNANTTLVAPNSRGRSSVEEDDAVASAPVHQGMTYHAIAAVDSDVVAEERRIFEKWAAPSSELAARTTDTIAIRGVHLRYPNGKHAVRGISLGVAKDECFGLLGPNGAGKTSVIAMLCGLTKIGEGNIYLRGTVLGGFFPP